MPDNLIDLPIFDSKTDSLNAIIETPSGSHHKYKYDEKTHLFKIDKELPNGMVFPFSFGFLPSTIAEDGDPLDILVLMDTSVPIHPGSLAPAQVIGIIEAEQSEGGKTNRNDRLIGVSTASRVYNCLDSIEHATPGLMNEIEYFFKVYNTFFGREFKPLTRWGPQVAMKAIEKCAKEYQAKHSKSEESEEPQEPKKKEQMSEKQRQAAPANIRKASAVAKRKQTIKHLPKQTRSALGKQANKVKQEGS